MRWSAWDGEIKPAALCARRARRLRATQNACLARRCRRRARAPRHLAQLQGAACPAPRATLRGSLRDALAAARKEECIAEIGVQSGGSAAHGSNIMVMACNTSDLDRSRTCAFAARSENIEVALAARRMLTFLLEARRGGTLSRSDHRDGGHTPQLITASRRCFRAMRAWRQRACTWRRTLAR